MELTNTLLVETTRKALNFGRCTGCVNHRGLSPGDDRACCYVNVESKQCKNIPCDQCTNQKAFSVGVKLITSPNADVAGLARVGVPALMANLSFAKVDPNQLKPSSGYTR